MLESACARVAPLSVGELLFHDAAERDCRREDLALLQHLEQPTAPFPPHYHQQSSALLATLAAAAAEAAVV
eukprot:SAG11_NODE_5933_length_1430_cov_1.191585_1_plen_70_part_10